MQPSSPFSSQGLLAGIRTGPVLLGVIVDWIVTMVFSVVVTQLFLDPGIRDMNGDQFDAAFDAALATMYADPKFLLATLFFGTLATVIGAYTGARRAATLPLKHGLAIAVASGLTGLLVYLLPGDTASTPFPFWYNVAGWLILIPAGVLGGYLARQGDFQSPAGRQR